MVNIQVRYNQGHFNVRKALPNHRKKIHTIALFGILHPLIGMDIKIWPTYPEYLCPDFLFGKSMAKKYPTYLQFGHMVS